MIFSKSGTFFANDLRPMVPLLVVSEGNKNIRGQSVRFEEGLTAKYQWTELSNKNRRSFHEDALWHRYVYSHVNEYTYLYRPGVWVSTTTWSMEAWDHGEGA